jgi:hypothetical protein
MILDRQQFCDWMVSRGAETVPGAILWAYEEHLREPPRLWFFKVDTLDQDGDIELFERYGAICYSAGLDGYWWGVMDREAAVELWLRFG